MAKPLSPPIIYHDGQSIFLEWSGHAQRFPFSEGGLHKALRSIPHIASQPGYVTGRSNIANQLLSSRKSKIVAREGRRRVAATITDAEMQSAIDIVRRFRK
jgi:hypothetical protein